MAKSTPSFESTKGISRKLCFHYDIGYCKKFKLFCLRGKRIRAMKRLYFKYAKLCLYILTILGLVFICLNNGEAQDAVPEAATLVSPSNTITDITPAYTWIAESNSTWYYLWVDDSIGNRIAQWYTADQSGCAGEPANAPLHPTLNLLKATALGGSRHGMIAATVPGVPVWILFLNQHCRWITDVW
jgi:hypothetical protein